MNTVWAWPALPPPASAAAPPSRGDTQRAKPLPNSGCSTRPSSPQVRGVTVLPRRTTSGPMVPSTYLAMAPSGPNIWAISAGEASMPDLGAKGYLMASLRLKGS